MSAHHRAAPQPVPTARTRPGRHLAAGLALALAATVALPLLVAAPVGAQAGGPLSCPSSTIFISQDDQTQLASLDFEDGGASFSDVGSPADTRYNALAFNPADRYLYAFGVSPDDATLRDHLLRIDAAGAVTDLGLVPGGPGGNVRPNAGDIGEDGTFYVLRENQGTLYAVDLAGPSAVATTLSRTVNAADVAWIDGYLWGAEREGNLVRIDPATGQVDAFAFPALPTGGEAYGAAWRFGNGALGVSKNDTGTISTIAITDGGSASPSFELVATRPGPASQVNDGATCIGEPVDLAVDKEAPAVVEAGGEISWTVTVTNLGPGDSSGSTVTDTLPAGVSDVTADPSDTCEVQPATVTCSFGPLASGESTAVTLTGTVTEGDGGVLENRAVVYGNEEDPTPDNDEDVVETAVEEPVDIPLLAPWALVAAAGAVLAAVGVPAVRRRRA